MFQYLIDTEITIADPYSTLVLTPNNDVFIPESTFPNIPDYPSEKTQDAISWVIPGAPEYTWQIDNFENSFGCLFDMFLMMKKICPYQKCCVKNICARFITGIPKFKILVFLTILCKKKRVTKKSRKSISELCFQQRVSPPPGRFPNISIPSGAQIIAFCFQKRKKQNRTSVACFSTSNTVSNFWKIPLNVGS